MTATRARCTADALDAIGPNLNRLRLQAGLSQVQLAHRIGVTHHCVSRWEGGSRTPWLRHLIALADYFDTTVDALVTAERAEHGKDSLLPTA